MGGYYGTEAQTGSLAGQPCRVVVAPDPILHLGLMTIRAVDRVLEVVLASAATALGFLMNF